MVELADALRSGRSGLRPVGVRVSPPAPTSLVRSCCRAQECGRHLSRGSSGAEFETAPSTVCYVVAALRAAFRNVGGTSGAESGPHHQRPPNVVAALRAASEMWEAPQVANPGHTHGNPNFPIAITPLKAYHQRNNPTCTAGET